MAPRPYPLTRRQRLGVRAWRGVFAAVTTVLRRRAPDPPAGSTEHRYGTHPDQRLDDIAPNPDTAQRTPVVYFHGGGWVCGKKEMFGEPLHGLADRGHRVFNVEYPLAPEHPHPEILRSLIEALAWIKRNNPDIEAVHLVGDSAGGNLATMLGILLANPSTAETLGFNELPPIRAAGIASLYGVLDRLTWLETGFPAARLFLAAYGGPEVFHENVELAHAITPMDVAFDHLPPMFIAAAGKDKLASSSLLAYEHFQADGHTVEHKVYDGASHGFYTQGKGKIELQQDVARFLSAH